MRRWPPPATPNVNRPLAIDSPELAETAFNDAFRTGDVESMMSLWLPAGDVLCVHPMGPALDDLDIIRTSWVEIFAAPVERIITTQLLSETRATGLVVRSVIEYFSMPSRNEAFAPVFATNTFCRGDSGWFIATHHASPGQVDGPPAEKIHEEIAGEVEPTRH